MDKLKWTGLACCAAGLAAAGQGERLQTPNLLIVHTDEHNFRTLGCYRELLSPDQAFVWGEGVQVETPHIDSIAHAGALCTSYYAASPVCTPSRASFVSGLYPVATGSPVNDMPMLDEVVTFAEILRRNGYATSYVGKWHLDGDAKPGFAPARKFGFDDNRYMINRGHWKMLADTPDGPGLPGKYNARTDRYDFDIAQATEESFTTDFLTSRAMDIISRDKDKPFCLMLSIPDPHGPNQVRAPYSMMFSDLFFKNPRTMDDPSPKPGWVLQGGSNHAEALKQEPMQWYFGMVKCIDDNVGRLLKHLEKYGLDRNTIVVFTSDHGDLMGEHGKHNKGLPYEASAKIPFVIRWPDRIAPGKVVHAAYTTADFAPTVLGMMGFGGQFDGRHGKDASSDFLGEDREVHSDRIVYITNAGGRWVAAVDSRYKLVLSPMDFPWLFDLKRDPDELINFYSDPEYKPVKERLKTELEKQMEQFGEPLLKEGTILYDTAGEVPARSAGRRAAAPSSESLEVLSGGEWLIDAHDLSVDASRGKAGEWTRVFAVPAGSFEKNSTYELILDWESGGLTDGSDFFVNFTGDRSERNRRQLIAWTGDKGETGTLTLELVAGDSDQWALFAGVRGGGVLTVNRIRIRKK